MKTKILLAVLGLVLVGCQSTRYQVSEPTASSEDILKLREELEGDVDMKVTDEGVVEFARWVPSGYKWQRAQTRNGAYEYSCINAVSLLEAGFTISIHFKGNGGDKYDYDLNRCKIEAERRAN